MLGISELWGFMQFKFSLSLSGEKTGGEVDTSQAYFLAGVTDLCGTAD